MFAILFKPKDSAIQKALFKKSFKRYFISYNKPSWKLWARSTEIIGEEYYLGTFNPITKYIERAKELYVLPWDVQKGAERLFRICESGRGVE